MASFQGPSPINHTQKRAYRLAEARKKGTHNKGQWLALVIEIDGMCPRCGIPADKFQKDHVGPLYQGGSDSILNIQPF